MTTVPDPLTAPTIPSAATADVAAPPEPSLGETAVEFPLHDRVHELWWWHGLVLGAIFTAAGFVPSIIVGVATDRNWVLLGGMGLAVLLGALLWRLTIRYYAAYARHFRCALLPDGLLFARGVFWRKQTFVPRARVQHTDVNEGPVARNFGIATLVVFTAGSEEAQIEVEGLSRASALQLRDRLLGRGHDAL